MERNKRNAPIPFVVSVSFKNVRNRLFKWNFTSYFCSSLPNFVLNSSFVFVGACSPYVLALHVQQHRVMSFCSINNLKRLEAVCTITNNSKEVRAILTTIRQGFVGSKSANEIATIRDAVAHLCNMTENLLSQDDVSP